MSEMSQLEKLQSVCRVIREDIHRMVAAAGSGHPGGSLSTVEILVGLYFSRIKFHIPSSTAQVGDVILYAPA